MAGVSIKTVSRVLNQEPNVRPATQQKVQEVIKQLNYRPKASARSLAGNRSYLLGLLYDNPSASYVTKVQNGVLRTCHEQNYDLLIHPCQYQSQDVKTEITNLVRNTQVDGIVVTPPLTDTTNIISTLDNLGVPYVMLSPGAKRNSELTVHTNDREVSAAMVQHLAEFGHKRIAFIKGHPDHQAIESRFEGYLDGMKSSGLKVLKSLCVQGFNSFESGVESAEKLLRMKNRPSAIFASNDDMAAGVIKVASRHGLVVPDDLSVAGFDDIPLAYHISPSLTTIRQPMREMAELAAELLIKNLRGQSTEEINRIINSELIVRNSTGPAS
jgi:LacI family transcriptional regulator